MLSLRRAVSEINVRFGVFGGDADEMEFTVSVAFPELPLLPVEERRTVRVA